MTLAVLALNVLDYWLWPQLNKQDSSYSTTDANNNSIVVSYTNQQRYDGISTNVDRFWEKFAFDDCFNEGGCAWTSILAMSASFWLLNVLGCIYLETSERFAVVYCPALSFSTCFFHQFAVRGRFMPPNATMIWAGTLGAVIGVSNWACISFMCAEPKRPHLAP
jgi:hypothetical protein